MTDEQKPWSYSERDIVDIVHDLLTANYGENYDLTLDDWNGAEMIFSSSDNALEVVVNEFTLEITER